ncbi:MAG: hypothetical protein ACM30H_07055 [Clostridia bacterium]
MIRAAIAVTFAVLACGCTTPEPPPATAPQQASALLGQTQLPPGAKVRNDESFVMGSGDDWLGRLVLETTQDTASAYQYFLDGYPRQGWTLLSATRSRTSLLVFTRQERTATVEVAEAGFGRGTLVTLTVSPKGAPPAPVKKP